MRATNASYMCNFQFFSLKQSEFKIFFNPTHPKTSFKYIILIKNDLWDILHSCFCTRIWIPEYILYSQYISIQTSRISSAQQPHVASGYRTGQYRCRRAIIRPRDGASMLSFWEQNSVKQPLKEVAPSFTWEEIFLHIISYLRIRTQMWEGCLLGMSTTTFIWSKLRQTLFSTEIKSDVAAWIDRTGFVFHITQDQWMS